MESTPTLLREDDPFGFKVYIPPPTQTSVLENSDSPKRNTIFVYGKDGQLRCVDYQEDQPLLSILSKFKKDPEKYDIYAKKNQNMVKIEDLKRTLKEEGLGQEAVLQLVIKKCPNVKKQLNEKRQLKVQIETKEQIKIITHNILGVQSIQHLLNIIDQQPNKSVRIIGRVKSCGGDFLLESTQIPIPDIKQIYEMRFETPLSYIIKLSSQKIETQVKLIESLQNIVDKQELQHSVNNIKIFEPKADKPNWYLQLLQNSIIPLASFAAITLWTGNSFFRDLNLKLRENQMLPDGYLKQLKYMEEGLKLIPSQSRLIYRGLRNCSPKADQKKPGNFITQQVVFGSSSVRDEAERYAQYIGDLMLIIHSKKARPIFRSSQYPNEFEYLLPPYSQFKVKSYTESSISYSQLELIEVPSPRSTNILIWVLGSSQEYQEDKNMNFSMELEVNNKFSVLPAFSNEEVVDIITTSPFMLKTEYFNLKIVTNGHQKGFSEELKTKLRAKRQLSQNHIQNSAVQLLDYLKEKNYMRLNPVQNNPNKMMFFSENTLEVDKFKKQLNKYYKLQGKQGINVIISKSEAQLKKYMFGLETKSTIQCPIPNSDCKLF